MPTGSIKRSLVGNYTIPTELKEELEQEIKVEDSASTISIKKSILKSEYQERNYKRNVDLDFENVKSYKDVMAERDFERMESDVKRQIEKANNEGEKDQESNSRRKRRKRWDITPEERELLLESSQHDNNYMVSSGEVASTKARDSLIPEVHGIRLTDALLDKILPHGYTAVFPPKRLSTSGKPEAVSLAITDYYVPPLAEQGDLKTVKAMERSIPTEVPGITGLDHVNEKDLTYFNKLFSVADPAVSLENKEDKREVEVMKLLLKIKNGVPSTRKKAMRLLTENSRSFGPKAIFAQVLPLLLEPTLEDQERHILVKLIGRILFQLEEQVRPYVKKILSVVSPLLIDEDFTLRLEAREIISSLTKAAGLASIIASLRPDLEHVDEYVRNLTSRVFAIVANTMGLVNFLPFLKAVIKSKRNWMVRHTGIKIVQQLGILLGGGNGTSILPYLSQLVEVLKPGLTDEVLQVRTITALALAQLAENVKPYGIEAFESILEPVWYGLKRHRGKVLANFLRCIGNIIPLMVYDPAYEEYANYYTRELAFVIAREFNSPDDEMKKTILKILSNLPLSKQMIKNYEKDIINPFFRFFWNRRLASDSRQLTRFVVEATNHLATCFDFYEVLEMVSKNSKDENENLRIMSLETMTKMFNLNPDAILGLDSQLEIHLVDGILFAFQEQNADNRIYLQSFDVLARTLNVRLSPHLNSIMSTILYRLRNKDPQTRQQASDLIVIMAPVIRKCTEGDDTLLLKLILILYESLGEIYPEVLGSLLGALHACIHNVDKTTIFVMDNPSINQILPTLTPILKNRHEKVQESCIKLVGLIANRNSESINAKEWMRICFELLEMLKSNKKRIRIAANDTFGYIAKTIGPQDVIVMLLNNLRVQERQLRVCTAVAIGIVADTCLPFTVLPVLMNEYRVPENNVQNGVLKALSFLFEYIEGRMTKDYLYAITPLLEDALTDRDHVHRQTAATVIKHMAMNCIGITDDVYVSVFIHFLNLLMPNIYETSPHVINRILESIDALRLVIGIGTFSNYIWSGLFHPARKVRSPYWKIFNSAYICNSETLVPYYPSVSHVNGDSFDYYVEEMDLFI